MLEHQHLIVILGVELDAGERAPYSRLNDHGKQYRGTLTIHCRRIKKINVNVNSC